MDIKLLLLDLDDTLLNSKGDISQQTIDTLHNVSKTKVITAIASGRMHASLMPYINILDTHGPVISFNGALIKDSVTGNVMYEKPISMTMAKAVIDFAETNDIHCQYYSVDEYYFKKHNSISDTYFALTGIKGIAVGDDLKNAIGEPPLKILLIDDDIDKVKKLRTLCEAKFDGQLEITQSKSQYIEIMSYNASKGDALARLCAIYNIPIENTMAIGDGQNDLDMIRNAGIGIAVDNGHPRLKDIADIICDSADNNGPAKIINELLLNKTWRT